ncbi:VWA domain-containing protein [Halapricum sp. CBA1109]|uniref:vWA domain-containing protein n=1 Tax=Halapricum sp. CBA1109 TaxID=2668068 RepID=UPI0012F72BF7|nr:VWA domain-containing protein [Halapricum sp. CBA1109]MUV90227.1 VWA domain-containing protein [Halapricum sp. CBA1109]
MDANRRRYLRLCALGATGVTLAGCTGQRAPDDDTEDGDDGPTDDPMTDDSSGPSGVEKIDDWQYDPEEAGERSVSISSGNATAANSSVSYSSAGASADAAESIGLSAGGATNIADFRRNVEEGYLPLPESVAYEGLFYNYYFDTGSNGTCQSLFCPSYSTAVTEDPLGGETEQYITVGLDSNLTTESFERKQLNVVVVLDISGSMGSPFDQYYYDRFGNRHEIEEGDDRSKIAVARDALESLTEQLRPEDRLGVVLYESEASVAKPLRPVEATDMDAIRDHIQEDVQARGGTNLDAGMAEATAMLEEYAGADQTETENRQIVITDAMPNTGQTDDESLQDRLDDHAENTIHTSFVGVGVDFNPELVDQITAVEGANYRAVHSAETFETYLGEEFEYMVTPLVYDLTVELDAEGYEVATVYGSSAAEESTDALIEVNTLFPSPQEAGRTRGGVVLVQLDGSGEGELTLDASWEDRTGDEGETIKTVTFPAAEPEHFDTTGIRKAVLLSRYGDLLRNWLVHARDPEAVPLEDDGIGVPPAESLGEWEQQSQALTIGSEYAERMRQFREHFAAEMDAIGDDELEQDLSTMDTILDAA